MQLAVKIQSLPLQSTGLFVVPIRSCCFVSVTCILSCSSAGVPYSEHSSYPELRSFVQFLRPDRVVSTVGGVKARMESESHCHRWLAEGPSTAGKRLSQTTLHQMTASLH